jgi:cobalt/nickel transport system ATP-binding protein
MVLQPQLLFLDEPTAYLDSYQVTNFHGLLNQIQQQGTTLVIATHNLDFVEAWADWVLVLDGGKLACQGTPKAVFSQGQQLQDLGLGVPLVGDLINWLQAENMALSETQLNQIQQQIRDRYWRSNS